MFRSRLAIAGVCAWPNLLLLPDGTLVVMVFNQPCHGLWEGDLDCWASNDQGRSWHYRSRVAEHRPGTNRMNCAAGIGADGQLLVLCGGFADRTPVGQPTSVASAHALPPVLCRSSDGGRSWQRDSSFPVRPPAQAKASLTEPNEVDAYIPYGNIVTPTPRHWYATPYFVSARGRSSHFVYSEDDGRSWTWVATITTDATETALLPLGSDGWLAACRRHTPEGSGFVQQFRAGPEGSGWEPEAVVSDSQQIPANLLRLDDGRIWLSYGARNPDGSGIYGRLSADEGVTWTPAIRCGAVRSNDSGYPSSVQLADGSILIAYYTKTSLPHQYEMRTVRLHPEQAANID